MKLSKKIVVLMLAFMLIGFLGTTGVKAGPATDEEIICTYEPKFTVEAVNNETAIKVTIPEQTYYFNPHSGSIYHPSGYQITIDYSEKDERRNPSDYFEGLYDKYYTGLAAGGNGPYKVTDRPSLGRAYDLMMDGSEKREYTYKNLDPGVYVVKVRAYAYGTGTYSYYGNGYKSEETVETITLKKDDIAYKEITAGYKTKYDFSKVKKGDIIKFGAYEQDTILENGREPIEWIVLEKTKKHVFVVSKYSLDQLPYDTRYGYVTWENCTLRKWLNDSFYNFAFNKSERKLIKTVTLKNQANPSTKVSGGKDTKDKIFILSLQDVTNTKYGFSKKALTLDEKRRSSFAWNQNAGGRYLLRTPAYDLNHVLFVGSEGGINYEYGTKVGGEYYISAGLGIRPAMYIKIN